MKKLFCIGALLLSGIAFTQLNAAPMEVASLASSQQEVIYLNVKATKDPSKTPKIYQPMKVSWDGSECWVFSKGGKELPQPIRATYSTTYRGFPYMVRINGECWYFSL